NPRVHTTKADRDSAVKEVTQLQQELVHLLRTLTLEDENDFLVQLCKLSSKLLRQRGKIPFFVPPPKQDDASAEIEEDSLPEKDDVAVANDKYDHNSLSVQVNSLNEQKNTKFNIVYFMVIVWKFELSLIKDESDDANMGEPRFTLLLRILLDWVRKYLKWSHRAQSFDKKDIKVENVMDLCKEELKQKNLFSVSDCKMYWQSNGEYLAVKVDRYTKTKKSTYNGFELFRIKKRDIPIEVFELDNNMTRLLHFLRSQRV
ncbi:eukaryotic translation initiation factor 3 subunit B-like protein, partial [Tanacetum coccineum]